MCVNPEGNGAILSAGERGGPGPPGGEENGRWHRQWRRLDVPKMSEGMGNGLDRTPRCPYTQSTYHCVYHVQ
jgi:hypothetical protein